MNDGMPTYWPSFRQRPVKDTVHLALILSPLATDERHTHCPKTPAEERHPFELLFGKPATAAEHAGTYCQLLDHVKVGPFYVVRDHNCAFARGQLIAGHDDARAVDAREDDLDAAPYELGYG